MGKHENREEETWRRAFPCCSRSRGVGREVEFRNIPLKRLPRPPPSPTHTHTHTYPHPPLRRFRRQISRNRGETFTRRRTLCAAKDDPNSRFAASLFGFIFPLPCRRIPIFKQARFVSVEISPWRSTTWGRPGYARPIPGPRPQKLFF